MADAAQGAIPVTPTTVWLYKKYNICERGCQDRGRQREIPDTYGKYVTPFGPILFHIRESLEVEIKL